MSLKERLKSMSNWTAALMSAATIQSAEASSEPIVDNVDRNAPVSSISRPATEYLDYRTAQGSRVNGETTKERKERFQKIKKEKGVGALLDTLDKEELKTLEIPQKNEKGYYLFETYRADKKSSDYESYYPHGVLRAKLYAGSEKAEGYYPDGSKRFDRTAGGIETKYHPGGAKGQEKIMETPHGLYDAYDVLDEQGRRTEHHHAVTDSHTEFRTGAHSIKDVKKIDLYNPQTGKMEATYTLDEWSIQKGRLASIGLVGPDGQMKTLDFPDDGKKQYYVSKLTTKNIQNLYQKNQEKNMALQKMATAKLSENR